MLDRMVQHRFHPASPMELSYAIVSAIARRMEQFVTARARDVALLERTVAQAESKDPRRLVEDMFQLRHQLLTVQTMANQSRDVFSRAKTLSPRFLPAASHAWVEDLLDQFDRVRSLAEGENLFLQGVIDLYQTRTATELNLFAKQLTSIGAILVMTTLIAGIYGMNFEHMPELGWKYGYLYALALMAVLSAGPRRRVPPQAMVVTTCRIYVSAGAGRPSWRRISACTSSMGRVASTLATNSLRSNSSMIGCGLGVVVPQPCRERVGVVVLAGHQRAAARVARVGLLGSAPEEVVVEPARRTEATGEHPARHLRVGELEQDHRVDVVALEEELGLSGVARKAVDDEAVVPVVLAEPALHDRLHQFVVDQLTDGHDPPHLGAEFGVVLDVPSEDLADGDVDQIEVARQQLGLRALPASLHSHDHVFVHDRERCTPHGARWSKVGQPEATCCGRTNRWRPSSSNARPVSWPRAGSTSIRSATGTFW